MIRHWEALLGIAALAATTVCASVAGEKTGSTIADSTVHAASGGSVEGEKPASGMALQRRNPRYQLCKGDILDLSFPFTPELNQAVTIQPDGFITLSAVGDVHIAGLTVPEFRDLLQVSYAKILRKPVINVLLKDFQKPYFIAGGEVTHPGKFELRDDTTVTQAVTIAGGFTENSKHSQVLLFRRVSNDLVEVKQLNIKQMLQAKNLTEDLHLQPGDMLYVPRNLISKIKKYIPYPSLGMFLDPTKF